MKRMALIQLNPLLNISDHYDTVRHIINRPEFNLPCKHIVIGDDPGLKKMAKDIFGARRPSIEPLLGSMEAIRVFQKMKILEGLEFKGSLLERYTELSLLMDKLIEKKQPSIIAVGFFPFIVKALKTSSPHRLYKRCLIEETFRCAALITKDPKKVPEITLAL